MTLGRSWGPARTPHIAPALPSPASNSCQDFPHPRACYHCCHRCRDKSTLPSSQSPGTGSGQPQRTSTRFIFYCSLFTGPANRTLYPGPLFLCVPAYGTVHHMSMSQIVTDSSFLFFVFPYFALFFSKSGGIFCLSGSV